MYLSALEMIEWGKKGRDARKKRILNRVLLTIQKAKANTTVSDFCTGCLLEATKDGKVSCLAVFWYGV